MLEPVTLRRHCSAAALVVTLSVANLGVCAGWASTAQARLDCCASGTACPMKHSGGGDADGGQGLSQSEADACCAAAEPGGSTQSGPTLASTISPAVLGAGAVMPLLRPVEHRSWTRSGDPPPSAIPDDRYLLLTVFLI